MDVAGASTAPVDTMKPAKGVSLYSRLINRPVGRVLARLACRVGLPANAVTVVSAVLTAAGITTLALFPPSSLLGVGVAALLALGFAFDSADGQVARMTGTTSSAGEWLDHVVDSGKVLAVHSAVLVGWFRFDIETGAWLALPLGFQFVAVVMFSGLTTVALLMRLQTKREPVNRVALTAATGPSLPRALALLPADYGILCWTFLLWGAPEVFRFVYLGLFVLNAAILVAFLIKWFGELVAGDRRGRSDSEQLGSEVSGNGLPVRLHQRGTAATLAGMSRMPHRLAGKLLQALMAIVPARRQVFVEAFPNDEGNAVEVVRALIARYAGTIVWAGAPDVARCKALKLDPGRFRRVEKKSPHGVIAFLRSEVIFTTHGSYGCPKPVRGKAIVNLWHGDGPKGHAGTVVPSTYLVSGSGVFGRRLADAFGVPEDGLLLTGLPRITQIRHPVEASGLRNLGVDPDRPFVVWMPTVRQYYAAGVNPARSDTTDPGADLALADLIKPGIRALETLDIQVLVKPHPIDLVSRTFEGFTAISDADLVAAGTTLYAFLGASSGLLTDYSSVWTDYLVLDRPIAFFTPDLQAYLAGRGVHPRSLELLPGSTLKTVADFVDFGREVLGELDGTGRRLRQQAREEFQITHPVSPADELLDELRARNALLVEDSAARAALQGAH